MLTILKLRLYYNDVCETHISMYKKSIVLYKITLTGIIIKEVLMIMENVLNVAQYIYDEYKRETGLSSKVNLLLSKKVLCKFNYSMIV